jgi:hypothetical protein
MTRVTDDDTSWPEVAACLAAAHSYWLCTTMPSGAPHAAPVWGVVLDHVLYLYSERRTVKARNLAADPRVVIHLESAENVVIVRGTAEDLGTPAQVPEVVAAVSAKYTGDEERQYLPDADPDFDIVYAIRPQSAMMWRLADYESSQRRWTLRELEPDDRFLVRRAVKVLSQHLAEDGLRWVGTHEERHGRSKLDGIYVPEDLRGVLPLDSRQNARALPQPGTEYWMPEVGLCLGDRGDPELS